MEHHWSNLNLNQAYGRLPTPANAAAAAGLNRFDLHLLEQQGFATAGSFAVFLQHINYKSPSVCISRL